MKIKNEMIDGVDISSLLEEGKSIKRKEIYWHYPHYHGSGWLPGSAICQGDWKLLEFYVNHTIELYNLKDDISESIDLSEKFPEKAISLKKRLHELQKSMNANTVEINENFNN
nr:sulfatase/phosphatase domain-containing protein [Lutibacter sp. Hel_I_33_5]